MLASSREFAFGNSRSGMPVRWSMAQKVGTTIGITVVTVRVSDLQ